MGVVNELFGSSCCHSKLRGSLVLGQSGRGLAGWLPRLEEPPGQSNHTATCSTTHHNPVILSIAFRETSPFITSKLFRVGIELLHRIH